MIRVGYVASGALLLASVWLWPLPALPVPPFSKHMATHMAVVALAAPLFSLGLAGGRHDPVVRAPRMLSAIAASMVELVLVWAWHAPSLHHLARRAPAAAVLEQATFLSAGVLLWSAALGGSPSQRRARAGEGIVGLLLTSMHMTLLGALIALSNRRLYAHSSSSSWLTPLQDQQLGGAIMILLGGAAYLAGTLGLAMDVLRRPRARGTWA